MKRKRKKGRISFFIGMIAFYTLLVSGSLAMFSEMINIEGTATSLDYQCDEKLEVILSKLDSDNDRYVAGEVPLRVYIESEILEENELTLTYRATHSNSPANRATNIFFEFLNGYPFQLTDGNLQVSYSSQNDNLYNVVPSLSSVVVYPAEEVTLSITFMVRLNNLNGRVSSHIEVNYNVDECKKKFIINIVLLPML